MTTFTTPQQIAADIARDFRTDNSRWTQGSFAKAKDGLPVGPRHPAATCFCLAGAIKVRIPAETIYDDNLRSRTYGAFNDAVEGDRDSGDFIDWNDVLGRKVTEVIELCDKVAAS